MKGSDSMTWHTASNPGAHRRFVRALAEARQRGIRGGAPDDDGNSDEGGDASPPADAKVAKANARARKAEERAKAAEAKAKEREDAEAKQKRDAELKDADSAKAALAEAEAREKKANERLAAFEEREAKRIEALEARLPDADKERVAKYRDRLGDDYGSFVEEELARHSPGGNEVNDDNPNPPPPANPGIVTRRNAGDGRTIEPWAQAKLDEMGVDTTLSKKSLVVERDGNTAKFIFPPAKMKNMLKERALQPTQLTREQREKLHG